MATVLIVDDDPSVLFVLKELLEERGHATLSASSGYDALGLLDGVDLVLTDLQMPVMNGMELLRMVRERDASIPAILLTAHGSEKDAVNAMKSGAYDYLTKPFDIDEVALVVERALESRALRVDNRRLVSERALGRRMVGEAPAMRRLLDAVERIAEKDVTVLIRGETGTGKELVAALLHARSKRVKGPFVRFNCAAIPAELAESQLFGHVKGAFTGATGAAQGFFSEAHGGTIVLDEVGELPPNVQAALLRALQDGEIQRVGSSRVEKVDVRIIASSNRDLEAEAKAGRFRSDLYYRLAVVELTVPPLRERRSDIPALAEEFARRYGDKFGLAQLRLAPELLARLAVASWPGNVRQLENTIARLAALSLGGLIEAEAFEASSSRTGEPPALDVGTAELGPSLREQVEAFERNLVARALESAGGNQSEAARRLATSRATLMDKLKKYGLTR
ncbi:MAG: sigma-54 dependent transcriptional regulator [Myxococcales bacterium]|jgi:two-component system response regulator AtoC